MNINNVISRDRLSHSICRLADDAHIGVAGTVILDEVGNDRPLVEECFACNHRWIGSGISIEGRGATLVQRGDWKVLVFGLSDLHNGLQQLMKQLLDEVTKTGGVSSVLPQLCFDLLPGAAVVAIDTAGRRAYLIRDGAGFRPLYYTMSGATLHFSTSVKSVRSVMTTEGINTDKMVEMLVFGHRAGGRTLWQGLDVVPPGAVVKLGPTSERRVEFFWQHAHMFSVDERRRLENQHVSQTLAEVKSAVAKAVSSIPLGERIIVPCGGGVDSTLLGAYLSRLGADVTFWCINQPQAPLREQDWMEPLSAQLCIPVKYANVSREVFLIALLETLDRSAQPAIGPNAMGGHILRQMSRAEGAEWFVSGELCDTFFGGLSGFYHLSPRFRALRILSHLSKRMRHWLRQAMADLPSWLVARSKLGSDDMMSALVDGHFERASCVLEAAQFTYDGQSATQRMADMLTWHDLRLIPGTLHSAFFERDEWHGGTTFYPFAAPGIARLGIHLPHHLKYRNGSTKWIWRTFAAEFIGRQVAFRRKYAFPTLTTQWLDRAAALVPNGFVADLLSTSLTDVWEAISSDHPAYWTIINIELWGRMHIWGWSKSKLLSTIS